MRMPPNSWISIWNGLQDAGDLSGRSLLGAKAAVAWSDLIAGSTLSGRAEELRGRSVLLVTADPFTAALALIELDGLARRIVLCPADLPNEHLPYVIDSAEADAVVSDSITPSHTRAGSMIRCRCGREVIPADYDRSDPYRTEWILLTSGTTGRPKLVAHTLASLAGAIARIRNHASMSPPVWSTFYDIRRYGGLQIFLRAVLTGTSLLLTGAQEPTTEFLARAGSLGVTHISGTPSHWRRALMSPAAHQISPQYVRLSGEIADQGILNHLRNFYPHAEVAHAFATTEAGVAFEVNDGLAGFTASVLEQTAGVELKVEDDSLRIRSARTANSYLHEDSSILKGADGFVDTGDMVELREGRYYFVGRRDGVINIGGLKVHPEEVEAIINRHPGVQVSLVRSRKSPITGAVVVADVVLSAASNSAALDVHALRHDILLACRQSLSPHKVPATIRIVPALAVAESGKLVRIDA